MPGDNFVINLRMEVPDGDEGSIKEAARWSPNAVSTWLIKIGCSELADIVTNPEHPINGEKLLKLTDNDLQGAPFFMDDLYEREHLLSCIGKLRENEQARPKRRKDDNTVHSEISSSPNCSGEDCREPYPPEKIKSLVGIVYLLTGFLATVVSLQFVHERVPYMEKTPPLPDVFFDMVPYKFESAFTACEAIEMTMCGIAALIVLLHQHRFIVFRRITFIVGTLYLYRGLSMYVTTLPVPGIHFKCSPKTHGRVWIMIKRGFTLLVGGGMSVTGAHHLCGDYLFSGHTLMMVVSYLTITTYTPKSWKYFHWVCWMAAIAAIFCILLAHDHYSIDICVAYIITTRLFYGFHTLCNHHVLKQSGSLNAMSNCWWFPLFRYFEGNVRSGHLPLRYDWPFPWPREYRSKYRTKLYPQN